MDSYGVGCADDWDVGVGAYDDPQVKSEEVSGGKGYAFARGGYLMERCRVKLQVTIKKEEKT